MTNTKTIIIFQNKPNRIMKNRIEHKIKKHTCAIGKITIFENDSVTLNPKIGETILQWVTAK